MCDFLVFSCFLSKVIQDLHHQGSTLIRNIHQLVDQNQNYVHIMPSWQLMYIRTSNSASKPGLFFLLSTFAILLMWALRSAVFKVVSPHSNSSLTAVCTNLYCSCMVRWKCIEVIRDDRCILSGPIVSALDQITWTYCTIALIQIVKPYLNCEEILSDIGFVFWGLPSIYSSSCSQNCASMN